MSIILLKIWKVFNEGVVGKFEGRASGGGAASTSSSGGTKRHVSGETETPSKVAGASGRAPRVSTKSDKKKRSET